MTSQVTPPLPHPPFFQIPNIQNLRDAALLPPDGLVTSNGGKIRPGILFRSAEVSKLDLPGWKAVKDIGIGHVFDLRSKPEVEKGWRGVTDDQNQAAVEDVERKGIRLEWMEEMEAAGVQRTWVPVFEASDYSPERLAERYLKYMDESTEGFVQAYHDILVHAGSAFGTILRYLASLPAPDAFESTGFLSNDPGAPIPPPTPLGALVHCTAGKDRTGIFFGILFSFLGVAKEKIAEEFNLTEVGLAPLREEVVTRLMASPGFKKYTVSLMEGKTVSSEDIAEMLKRVSGQGMTGDGKVDGEAAEVIPPEVMEKGRQAALRMISAKKESMLGALEMVEKEWGSAEGYLRKVVGLEDGELEALMRNLIVPA